MPLLGPLDPLPTPPDRVVVAGGSGSGKTTTCRRIEAAWGLPHTEIDGLFHGPGWVPRPAFEADVRRVVAGPQWVIEHQYTPVRPLLLERCDLVVWLDVPVPLQMWRVTRRTVVRRLRREVLWNGNLEPPLRRFVTDRDHVVRYAWRARHGTRARMRALLAERPDVPVVRLRRRGDLDAWLSGVGTPAPPR